MGQPSDPQLPAEDACPERAPARDAAPTEPTPRAPSRPRPTLRRVLADQAATVSSKLGPLMGRAGDRVAAASPTTLLLALLGVLVTASIVAALAFDGSLGVAATVLFIPALSAAVGAIAMRSVEDRRAVLKQRENARDDAQSLRQIEHTLDYVDAKLTTALTRFGTERHNEAVIGMFQAKAATELYLGTANTSERPCQRESEPDDIDLVSQYGLAELLTPRGVGEQAASTADSTRSCA